MACILLVDDELAIRKTFRTLLEGEGYAVTTARNADEALAKLAEARPDLVLLDVMMPGRNGFVACEEIRKTDKLLPVIFLTAVESEASQVRGFGLGADDYILKTAGDPELLARIRRALERSHVYGDVLPASVTLLRLGRIAVDLDRRFVYDEKGNELAQLKPPDAKLLRLLSQDRGRAFTNEQIVAELWGAGYTVEDTTVRSAVSRLKSKLGPAGELIVNDRGSGYKLIR